VTARIGWFLLLVVVVGTDVIAALNNKDSLTSTFRRSVAETGWRWPVLLIVVLLVAHLYMPPSLRRYDPLDRLYYRVNPASEPPPPGVGPVESEPDPQEVPELPQPTPTPPTSSAPPPAAPPG
jgi:hypothetical protein